MPEERDRRSPDHQRIRLGLGFLMVILYPVTFAYLSCPLITEAAAGGILAGGLVVFALIFTSSLVIGRFFCGYLCPSGSLQDIYRRVHDKALWTKKLDGLKYVIFLGIFGNLAFVIWSAGGLKTIDLFYGTKNGISITAVGGIAAFLGPVIIITIFVIFFGRRGFCHALCPIAVITVIGRKCRNIIGWPALQLVADSDRCTDCKKCSEDCSMSLDVNRMVRTGMMENTECILCGNCVDTCRGDAISYTWAEKGSRERS